MDVRSLQRQLDELKEQLSNSIQHSASIEGSVDADAARFSENSSSLNARLNVPRELGRAATNLQNTHVHPLSPEGMLSNLQREQPWAPSILSPLRADGYSLGRVQKLNDNDRMLSPEPTPKGRDIQVYGATSLLHDHLSEILLANSQSKENEDDIRLKSARQDRLIAYAAISRQREITLHSMPSITANIDFDGVSVDMGMHLLELHWNRQHLSYLVTYRPAIMDSLVNNGPYVNKLLLNAIYLQSSLYSDRNSLLLDPRDPQTTGMVFYNRFKALLGGYVDKPTPPTVAALLTCGACLVPHGKQSAGWLFCGMAYRMIIDLGYHLDIAKYPKAEVEFGLSVVDLEMRRRLYWGAYVCDKFQCLFLGRPPAMDQLDSSLLCGYLDLYEEMEEWKPYIDPQMQSFASDTPTYRGSPSYALSTFQCLLRLCMIAARIIEAFYSIKSAKTPQEVLLQTRYEIREQLEHWKLSLPLYLQFDPTKDYTPPPHQITPQLGLA